MILEMWALALTRVISWSFTFQLDQREAHNKSILLFMCAEIALQKRLDAQLIAQILMIP